MDLNKIAQLADSESFFLVLFVAGIIYIALWVRTQLQDNKEDSKRREEQLIDIYRSQIERGEEREGTLLRQSQEREKDLMEYLDRNSDQLENIAGTLKEVQSNLVKVEDRMQDNFQIVWKELGNKEDRK